MPRIEVRLLRNIEEFRQCERIQTHVWGDPAVSTEVLSVTQEHGGAVVGSVIDGKVVGFIYAFLARHHGRLVHWSHMMAVEAKFRDQGFGLRMKLVHRELALKNGIRSICWTFDPLQSRNANLNIARLGARIDEYVPDCYGDFASLLEKGLPTDRLVANWHVGTARVRDHLKGKTPPFDPRLPHVNETRLNSHGFRENQTIRLNLTGPRVLVEIPTQTEEMRLRALPLSRRWRLEIRRVFARYLPAGYHVEDFFAPQPATEGRSFYLLRCGSRRQP
jgi:predicted GNAT superfamily acetyltransferase